jgi:hypothetical protein
MRVRHLAVVIAVCFTTHANAKSCSELYSAVKREAMYCDFFCDQKRLAPLQQAYETKCIVIVVPLAFLSSFENASDEGGIFWYGAQDSNLIPNGSGFRSE